MNSSSLARFRLLLLVTLLAVVAAGCGYTRIGVQWPSISTVQYNGDARIMVAYNERLDMIDPANGAQARLFNSDGEVRLDDQGNPRLWTVNGAEYDQAQFFIAPLQPDEETLLVPTYGASLLEIDLLTARPGTPLALPVEGHLLTSPVVSDDHVIFPYSAEDLIAYNEDMSAEAWTFDTEEGIWSTPVLHEGVLYFGGMGHDLYAVDAETGSAVWDEPVDLGGAILSAPLLLDDHLYIGNLSHKMYKVSLDGEVVDEFEATNWIWHTPVSAGDGIIYFADLNGNVYALDTAGMDEVWQGKIGERGIRPSPLIVGEQLIVASRDGRIHWLNRFDGTKIFEREIEGRPEILSEMLLLEAGAAARVDEDMVVVATVDPGRLVAAYTIEEGRLAWMYGR